MLIKVNSIAEEYTYLQRTRCECSGQFRVSMQRTTERGSTPVDVFEIACEKCGQPSVVEFDISSFYGNLEKSVKGVSLSSQQAQEASRIADALLRRSRGENVPLPKIAAPSTKSTPNMHPSSSRYPNATWLTIMYTMYTWIPIIMLFYAGNGWVGIPVKIGCVLWLLVTVHNLFRHPLILSWIGAAGPGFFLNALWFAMLNLWPPYWARVLLILLIVFGIGGIHFSITSQANEAIAPNTKRAL